jgi:hypothetical protein
MKIKTSSLVATMLLVLAKSVFSQDVITPLFPLKDGFVSPDSGSGDQQELLVDGTRQAAGWMVFKSAGIYYRNIGSAMLAVYIKTVSKPGLCGIHSLMTKISAPENRVTPADVKFDDMPIAALPLDSSFSDQMILVNITELVQSRAFYGIALRSINGLSANFSSKEGFPPPAILLTHEPASPTPAKWFNGIDPPDMSTGGAGDYYVHIPRGVIYRKSAGAWDSVASLTIPPPPPEKPAAPALGKRPLHRPYKKTLP